MNSKINSDLKYLRIVRDILENDEFQKTKNITHHGMTRFDHSVRVSYYSYKIAKLLFLDYKDVARAGLLHDFFFTDNKNIRIKTRMYTLYNHPKFALSNASQNFYLSEKEKDIIRSHMFPINIYVPRYLESWIVDLTDNIVAICEASTRFGKTIHKFSTAIFILFLTIFK